MLELLDDPRILQVLSVDGQRQWWERDLGRFLQGDETLTRKSAGEDGIKAFQRLLVFLGYSTTVRGGFSIDGDFGRGTNRGLAQFQFENGLTQVISRDTLCYPCHWQNAHLLITTIPDTRLDRPTLGALLTRALEAIESNEVTFGDFDEALFHLNAVHEHRWLSCRQILERYRGLVNRAIEQMLTDCGLDIRPEWILAIIRQETSGISRPRFEQHKLSREYETDRQRSFAESRLRSMSIGLGQIMGFNHARVGAASAREMLHSPASDQVLYVARFLAEEPEVVVRQEPRNKDFHTLAKHYNGSGYAKHGYHETLERWFREFRLLFERGE